MYDLHQIGVGLLCGDVEGPEGAQLRRNLGTTVPRAVRILIKVVAGTDGRIHRRRVEARDDALRRGAGRNGREEESEKDRRVIHRAAHSAFRIGRRNQDQSSEASAEHPARRGAEDLNERATHAWVRSGKMRQYYGEAGEPVTPYGAPREESRPLR